MGLTDVSNTQHAAVKFSNSQLDVESSLHIRATIAEDWEVGKGSRRDSDLLWNLFSRWKSIAKENAQDI